MKKTSFAFLVLIGILVIIFCHLVGDYVNQTVGLPVRWLTMIVQGIWVTIWCYWRWLEILSDNS